MEVKQTFWGKTHYWEFDFKQQRLDKTTKHTKVIMKKVTWNIKQRKKDWKWKKIRK